MTRVIGLGSPFGDDRAGWQVIERLKGRLPAQIELLALDRPGAALINWMYEIDHLILIDAALASAHDPPWFEVTEDRLSDAGGRVDTHSLGLAETLQLARTLGCAPARVSIYAIGVRESCQSQPDPQLPHTVEALAGFLISALADKTTLTPGENANLSALDRN